MADDDVTDLTEGEEEAGSAGGGKQKKEKAPKAPKEPKESKEKEPKEKGEKKGGAVGVILIMIIVLIILIGGFGAAMYFNVFDARTIVGETVNEPLLRLVIWLDPGFSSVDARLRDERDTQERRFAERELDIEARDLEVKEREAEINARQEQLDNRERNLNSREAQIIQMYERAIPIHRRENMSDQELEDMVSLSRTYTQMSPVNAAVILVEIYDQRDVAAILYFMGERPRGAIMAALHPAYAAEITEILLYS